MWHMLERALIHFFAAQGVYLLAYFLLRFAYRHSIFWLRWVGPIHRSRVAVAVFCIFWLGLWEGINVVSGQSELKVWTDYLSWIAGCGVAAWAFWRYWNAIQEDL